MTREDLKDRGRSAVYGAAAGGGAASTAVEATELARDLKAGQLGSRMMGAGKYGAIVGGAAAGGAALGAAIARPKKAQAARARRLQQNKELEVAKAFTEVTKRDWKNISQRETEIKQANRRRTQGSTVAAYGAGGLLADRAFRHSGSLHIPGSVKAASRQIHGGYKIRSMVEGKPKAAAVAARETGRVAGMITRSRPLAVAGGAGVAAGAGMIAHGSAERRYQEHKIAGIRRRRSSSEESAMEVHKAFGNAAAAIATKAGTQRGLALAGQGTGSKGLRLIRAGNRVPKSPAPSDKVTAAWKRAGTTRP